MAKSVFKKDLYSGLFSIGKVSLYNNKLAINGNECDLVYQEANKLLKEFIERQFINDKHNEASFFLFSDYEFKELNMIEAIFITSGDLLS